MKKVSNKGFTLIELIVVMAIICILVLLATPKFLNYIELANVTRIKHDTKVAEDLIIAHMVRNNSQFPKDVINIPIKKDKLEELLVAGDVYSKEGLVDKDGNITVNDGYFDSSNFTNISYADKNTKDIRGNVNFDTEDYFVIKKKYIKSEVRSRLKGEFIVERNARVLYVDKLDVFEDLYDEENQGGTEKPNLTITYTSDDSTGKPPVDNKKYLSNEDVIVMDKGELERDGFNFAGWTNEAGDIYQPGEILIIKENTELIAIWEKISTTEPPGGRQYTITYYDEKGEGDLPKDNKRYNHGEIAYISDGRTMYKQGHELKSWLNDDGSEYFLGQEVTMKKSLKLTANWEEIEDHEPPPPPTEGNLKVTYGVIGGGSGIPPVDNNRYSAGDTVIILESELTPPDWAKFYRWEDQDGNLYKGSQSVQISKDLNLKSKWIWENPGR